MKLQNQLWATAVQLAQDSGMEFTVPCSQNLRDLIAAGARDMHRDGLDSEAYLEKADASLSVLVREMIRVTQALGGRALSGTKTAIREAALVQAKELCPQWPFG